VYISASCIGILVVGIYVSCVGRMAVDIVVLRVDI